MFKRQTSKSRNHPRSKVLEARVMSPRIAWFGFLKFTGSLAKFALLLALVAALGWGVWLGVQRAFYKNPDFRLQVIDLNTNPAIDEAGLVEIGAIDVDASLFQIDVKAVQAKLLARPEIADAKVERHLPSTLVARVTPRVPRAWLTCPEVGFSNIREVGALLVDENGIAYPCPPLQLETAESLPVIELASLAEFPLTPGKTITHPELAHCFRLLDSACEADPESPQWIDSVKQVSEWALLLTTRDGTTATFGLGDHDRQINSLRAAMDHSSQKGYAISTINLIPKYNIPITLQSEVVAPRAIPVAEPTEAEIRENRKARDLNNLLNRN